jgi:hypothetical protein
MIKYIPVISSLCFAALIAGCATTATSPDEYSGFLKDYSLLKEDKSPSGMAVMRWIDPDLKASTFTSVYIEPSQLYPKPKPTTRIPQSTLTGITNYYDQALKREIGKSLPLATSPGPRTLIVRPAITAVSSKVEGFQPYELLPIALVAGAVNAAAGGRDQETSIATEVAFLDSDTNRVVAQLVRKGSGKNLENDKEVMTLVDVSAVLDGWASDVGQSFMKLKADAK